MAGRLSLTPPLVRPGPCDRPLGRFGPRGTRAAPRGEDGGTGEHRGEQGTGRAECLQAPIDGVDQFLGVEGEDRVGEGEQETEDHQHPEGRPGGDQRVHEHQTRRPGPDQRAAEEDRYGEGVAEQGHGTGGHPDGVPSRGGVVHGEGQGGQKEGPDQGPGEYPARVAQGGGGQQDDGQDPVDRRPRVPVAVRALVLLGGLALFPGVLFVLRAVRGVLAALAFSVVGALGDRRTHHQSGDRGQPGHHTGDDQTDPGPVERGQEQRQHAHT